MSLSDYASGERARSAVDEPSLFGPERPEEGALPPWEWRREGGRLLLVLVEATAFLGWVVAFLTWRGHAFSVPLLAGGWLGLELLALLAGHAVLRGEGRLGWARTRLVLAAAITVPTALWWLALSGGPRAALGEVAAVQRLAPGLAFWTLWLAIGAWARGLGWSHAALGLSEARHTLRLALVAVGALALFVPSATWPIVGALTLLWVAGWVAQALLRVAGEAWSLDERAPWRVARAQALLAAAVALLTVVLAQLPRWLLGPARLAAARDALREALREPVRMALLLLLDAAIFAITLAWRLFFALASTITRWLGITFTAREMPPFQPPVGSTDAFFEWLTNLVPPPLAALLRLLLFALFALVVLLWLLGRLDRLRYKRGQGAPALSEAEELPTRRRGLRLGLRRRRRQPLPSEEAQRPFVQLLEMGTARGLPRHPDATPYEYARSLRTLLPGMDAEVTLIADEYVRSRYGHEPFPAERRRALRRAWAMVRRADGRGRGRGMGV